MIALPYVFIFEFLAPFIEFIGFLVFIYQAFTGAVNWMSALVIFGAIYTFCIVLAMVIILYDYTLGGTFRKARSYIWIILAAFFEPFIYHPFIVFFSVRGYFNYIINKRAVWGEMTRKGFSGKKSEVKPNTAESSGVGGVS